MMLRIRTWALLGAIGLICGTALADIGPGPRPRKPEPRPEPTSPAEKPTTKPADGKPADAKPADSVIMGPKDHKIQVQYSDDVDAVVLVLPQKYLEELSKELKK